MKTMTAVLLLSAALPAFAADGGPMKASALASATSSYEDKTVCATGVTIKTAGEQNAALFQIKDKPSAQTSVWVLINGATDTYKAGDIIVACGPFKSSATVNGVSYQPIITALTHTLTKHHTPKHKPVHK